MTTTEIELLGSDYVGAQRRLSEQVTQLGGGFYQLARESDFEDRYPNEIDEFLTTDSVKKLASEAGINPLTLKPPFDIPDETVNEINDILDSADPLTLNDAELTKLRSDVDNVLDGITVPTVDELTNWAAAFKQFVTVASEQNVSFPTNTREIELVSTDISLDSFLDRTGVRKLVIIRINKLVYPFITSRLHVPSDLQGTLVDATGSKDDNNIYFSDVNKEPGVSEIKAGSIVLISNNAKEISQLEQQKIDVEFYSEESMNVRLKDPLLFDLSTEHVVQLYQYTADKVLSPGDLIKIPK
jgi:hypothetical protein